MQNNLIFTIETNIKNVMNTLEIKTNENILSAEIKYLDAYGYEKTSQLLNIQKKENTTLLTFHHFYSNKFDLVIDGSISEDLIEDIKIIPLNQENFYESKENDIKVDKAKLSAVTLCGQYSNKAPGFILDGLTNTNFHSADYRKYEPGTYGDVVIKLDEVQLIDKFEMVSASSGNGVIKTYEILYKTAESEDWKKIFEQTKDESGSKRLAQFKAVLASEICIRVTKGQNYFVVIYEADLFRHNFIDTRISNLFLDEAETILKSGVTLEEIEVLEKEVKTQSYIDRVIKAKKLYIDGLPKTNFTIPLSKETIFDKIQFMTNERVFKINLKYIDAYGIERLISTDFEAIGNLYTLNLNKIMTKSATIVMFGVSKIENISINSYNRADFYINEDVDCTISSNKITPSTTSSINSSYPLSNMFDGNLTSTFNSSVYTDYCDIYFKLDKEYLIDKLSLMSYRSNTSGLIKKFKVLAKEMNSENVWAELGEYTVDTFKNSWLDVKNKTAYLTNEICVRIEECVNNWAIVNEIKLYIHNNLEKEIDNLFKDDTFEELKSDVSYNEILELSEKVQNTEAYKDKIELAKKLYLDKKTPVYFTFEVEKKNVINEIKIQTTGKVYNTEITYKDDYGYEKIAKVLDIKVKDSEIVLTFEYFYANKFDLMLHGDITEELVNNIEVIELNQNEFYESKDIDVRLDKTKMIGKSYCGQYSNNVPSNAFDGDLNTSFHSDTYTKYTPGIYGDFGIELEKPYLLDRLQMVTRNSGNGRIKAYEVLYKTTKAEDWKKVFEQLTEESGVNRTAVFKPVLASEVCIRVTNGHGNFVVVTEVDLFKHNIIEERISNLFFDETESTIRLDLTLEEIEVLERDVKTNSYKERVTKAKELYIESLLVKEFLVSLNSERILDRVQFTTSERVLKVKVKYTDNYSNVKIIDVKCAIVGDVYTLIFEKVMAENLSILIWGAQKIDNISTNSFDKLEFCLNDDIDSRISSEKIVVRTDLPSSSYPAINMFDGNINSMFQCNHSKEYGEIFFKLDKEYLIDRLRLINFRSNSTSGLINKFKVLLKDMNSVDTWVELGDYTVEKYSNDWHLVEGKAYLTNEICLKVENSINNWTLINELELFIYNNFETSINNLFKDNNFEELKSDVSYEEILELSKKVKNTQIYKEKIELAKALYLAKTTKKNYKLNYEYDFVLDELIISYKTEVKGLVDYKLEYIDTLGETKYISDFEIITQNEKVVSLKFEKVLTRNLEVTISYIDEAESWKSSYAQVVEIDQTPYYIVDDQNRAYDNKLVKVISHCGVYNTVNNPPEMMLDGLKETMFHSKKTGKVEFILDEPKIINEFWVDSSHPNGNNGKIGTAKLYFKENDDQDWILLQEYISDQALFGMKLFKFQNVLVKRFCIDVQTCYAGVVIMNEIGFNIYSSLETKIDNLFNSDAQSLRDGVTLKMIQKLEKEVVQNKLLKAKLQIAKMILENKGILPLEVYGYKALDKISGEYFGPTVSNDTGNVMLGNHYISSNTDYIIAVNRDIQLSMGNTLNPSLNTTVDLKKGINHINVPYEGQAFFRGARKEKFEYYSLNERTSLSFRYGYDKSVDLFDKDYIETQIVGNYNSNLVYIEGNNYIGAVKFDWVKKNFKAENLTKHIESTDEYIDFLYYLDNVQGHFKEHIPYRRLMWTGSNGDNPYAGSCVFGGHTSYAGGSGGVLSNCTYDMGNSWAIGHEIGHEIDPNDYIMGLFGEVANNWYAEQGKHEFTKNVRCKGNTQNIALDPKPIAEYGFFDKLAVFYKLRLFYTDNSFFQKLNALMQETRANSNAEAADNYTKFFTQILKRDMSSYFVKYGFNPSESAIAYCNQYPAPSIELQYLTYDNHLDFIKEEMKLFNQKYKSASKIK
ncbi:MAG: discoidin domain-containing protein [Cetobacterium sp.]